MNFFQRKFGDKHYFAKNGVTCNEYKISAKFSELPNWTLALMFCKTGVKC